MAPRKAASGIETKEVLSAVVLADSFTQVRCALSHIRRSFCTGYIGRIPPPS